MGAGASLARTENHPFEKNGQNAWFHDEGFSAGIFHTFDHLNVGGNAHKVHVFLPRDYETHVGKRFRALYINDGDTAFFPGGPHGQCWEVAQVLADLNREKAIQPLIVVAVCPNDRQLEYGDNVDSYVAYLANHVKPWVDATYRTMPLPNSTFIMGSSLGGLASLVAAATHPGSFGGAVCMSPSMWVGTQVYDDLETSPLVQKVAPGLEQDPRPRLYLDWASKEGLIAKRCREFREILRSWGYTEPSSLLVVEDRLGNHNEASWKARLPRALKWLCPLPPAAEPPPA
mmetsp:Transcript_23092/g.54011  ORF Transcript_23092/g.54011 Transcript_23092/m.54011 type:complete len:287 (-) Transcript_23092:546-1406(-)